MRSAVLLATLFGCGVPAGVLTPETAAHLDVHPVDWNPRHERIDAVTGVEDFGTDVVVFSKGATAVIADGIINVDHADLRAGAIVPAPDGSGSWITGIDGHGRVFRLRARRTFEPVSDRYGLEGKDVRALVGFGGRYVAFALGDGHLAVADGTNVMQLDLTDADSLTAGGTRAWVARPHDLLAIDPRTRSSRSWALEDPRVAVDAAGHVFIASGRAVYEERVDGKLVLRYMASGSVRSLAASNDHVWFTDGGELAVITGSIVSRTHGAKVPAGAKLVGSLSGDVWSIDAQGALSRWAMGAPAARPSMGTWNEIVAPAFARACAGCHAPDGTSGVDLSTPAAWKTKHDLLRQRLVSDRDMPPRGHTLSDADRAALGAWLDAR